VSQFIEEHHFGSARQHSSHVEFGKGASPVKGLMRGNDLEFPLLLLRFAAPVPFDPTDDHSFSALGTSPALRQHAVRLPNPGGKPQGRCVSVRAL
jgi:hypothetical protein